jgi:hypothetical protein
LAGHNPLGSVWHFLFNPGRQGFHKQGGQMINDVVLEGIVVRDPWKFMDDLFFRLVIYRDSDLPAKKLDLEHDAGDYINVRVNGGANGLIHIRRGMRLRVHGFLQSRDFRESLEEFINKARKSKNCTDLAVDIKASELKQNQVFIDRNVVEAVARRIIVLMLPHRTRKKPDQSREFLLASTLKWKMIQVKWCLLLEKLTQLLNNSSTQQTEGERE